MAQEIPANKMDPGKSKVGPAGIPDVNASHERKEETVLQGSARESFVTKMIEKLKGLHPDWADDKVKTVATAAFNKAMQDKASGKGNEANAEEVLPASDMTGAK